MNDFSDRPEPVDIVLNGEPATEQQLATLATLANALLDSNGSEVNRSYQRRTEAGTILQLQTTTIEGCSGLPESATLVVCSPDDETTQLVMVFNDDNELDQLGIADDKDIDEIQALVSDLVTMEELDDHERAILGYVQASLTDLVHEDTTTLEDAVTYTANAERLPVAELIRGLTKSQSTCSVRSRDFSIRLDSDAELHLVANELQANDTFVIEVDFIPALQVELIDSQSGSGYLYTVFLDGARELRHFDNSRHFPEDDMDDDEDEEVLEWMEELGAFIPSHHGIEQLTEYLIAASLEAYIDKQGNLEQLN